MGHSSFVRRAAIRIASLAAVIAGFQISTVQAVPARAAVSLDDALARLGTNTAGALTSSVRADDHYLLVHSSGRLPLLADDAGALPEDRARAFLSIYGAALGLKDPVAELITGRVSRDAAGNTHVHMDQTYRGLSVFGARVVVHMNGSGITGTNGVFIGDLDGLSTTPKLSPAALEARGVAAATRLHPQQPLSIETARLMIYRSGLLKGVATQKSYLAYEVMVRGAAGAGIRERIILDADTGAVLNRIDEIHSVLNRIIYTPMYGTVPVLTEGSALAPADPPFTGDVTGSARKLDLPQNNLYVYAGGTWLLYKNLFGRDGYDDGAVKNPPQKQESVYLVNQQCPNAYWDGTSTNYCPGFDADDVVSHEWSHAYTEYTHGLVYQYQSGALNESYSDIFGETYDLVNGIEGPLGITLTEGDYFENGGSRWVVGEDLSEVAAGLLLRDMWDPDNFGVHVPILGIPVLSTPSPGSVITSPNYYCATGDNGGVHTNSGVSNHAYAMLVDGKTFNGVTIPKIGLVKAAHIYFQAETHYQTPTTNYPQHADALEQSCRDLIGAPLNDVFGNVSTEVIGPADCAAVHAVTLAVEFRNTAAQTVAQKCNYVPVLKPEAGTPALCGDGLYVTPTFSETWEGGVIPSTWTLNKNLTGDSEPPVFAFQVSSELPAPHTGKAAFAVDDSGGSCAAGGDQSGSYSMESPEITVPDNASFLSFSHFMQAEAGFDGGQLQYSVAGAAFALVPQDAFTYNAHSGTFEAGGATGTNTSPLAGQAGWTGSDQGEATGSWGTTIVDIARLNAAKGAKIRFRWVFGNDGCGGNKGWYVDDTQVFYCATSAPGDGTTTGGSTGSTTGTTTGSTTGGTTTGDTTGSTTGGTTGGTTGTTTGSTSGGTTGGTVGGTGPVTPAPSGERLGGGGSLGGFSLLVLLAGASRRRRLRS